ncbi:MAG: choice-of-anchor L domain-containing protein, partial [Azoarcus sp.]|nr:choice-of-anchor L domain-containing protein [Azoarcus sp.]
MYCSPSILTHHLQEQLSKDLTSFYFEALHFTHHLQEQPPMKKRQLLSLALGSIIMTSASLVHALDLFRPPMDEDDLEIKITNNPNVLVAALLGKDSRIKVVPGSVKFIGTARQSATYTGFNLEPLPDRGFDSSYSRRLLASPRKAERITNPDGILLTTGTAEGVNSLNSSVNFNSIPKPKTGSNSLLEALIGAKTYDQNVLSFQFTTTVSSVNGVSADFVFGS